MEKQNKDRVILHPYVHKLGCVQLFSQRVLVLKESFSRKIIVSVVVVAILQMNQILPHVYIDDLRPKGKEYENWRRFISFCRSMEAILALHRNIENNDRTSIITINYRKYTQYIFDSIWLVLLWPQIQCFCFDRNLFWFLSQQ